MPDIVFVHISDMRIQTVTVEIHVFFGIPRRQPGVLHGGVGIFHSGGQFAMTVALRPVVTVVANGADELVRGNCLPRDLQVLDKPVLRRDRAGRTAGVVLVIVHYDDAVRGRGNHRVIEILVVRLNAYIQLQALGVERTRELTKQSVIAGLALLGEFLKVHHQTVVFVSRKKRNDLLAKTRAGLRIVEECADVHPVGAVGVVHHGEYFHSRVFSLEERHHFSVHGMYQGTFDDREELAIILIDGLQSAIGGQYVQPLGVEQVNLACIFTQGRKAGSVPSYIKGGANSFPGVELERRTLVLAVPTLGGGQLASFPGLLGFRLAQCMIRLGFGLPK